MSVEETIRAQGAALAAAINAKDAAAAAELYTEDGAVLPPGAPIQKGIEAIRDFWTAAIEAGLTDLELETEEVTQVEDDAIEVGTLRGHMGATALSGKYIVHWKHSAQGWRLHRDIWNTDA